MSSTDTETTNQSETNPGQADGSHQVETEAGNEGQESQGSGNEGRETVSQPDAASVLQDQLREKDEAIQRLTSVLDTIDSDPEASKHARRAISGQPVRNENDDPIRAFVQKRFGKLDEETKANGAWVDTMTDLARTVREETLAEVERRVGSRFKDLDRQLSGNRFEQALEANGVDRDTQSTPEFKNFIREQSRSDKRFGRLRDEAPDVIGEMAALRWSVRESRKTQNGQERQRLDMARGAKLHSTSNRGGSNTRTAPVIDRYDPQRAEKLVDLMFRKGMKPDDIDFRK